MPMPRSGRHQPLCEYLCYKLIFCHAQCNMPTRIADRVTCIEQAFEEGIQIWYCRSEGGHASTANPSSQLFWDGGSQFSAPLV